MKSIKESRDLLRSDLWGELRRWDTDQKKGIPPPQPQKPYPKNAELVDLIEPDNITVGDMSLKEVIERRRSRRKFTNEPLTLEEFSFLLWSTQGVQEKRAIRVFKTVPSGGARHSFETYLVVNRVNGLEPGLYRYLPFEHKLLHLYSEPNLDEKMTEACNGQKFVKEAAVVFAWTTIPYRTEWRYHLIAHKIIAIDAGHLCQNLYLASEAIQAGACAIGAYSQDKVDDLLKVDGVDELTVYIAPVGKIHP